MANVEGTYGNICNVCHTLPACATRRQTRQHVAMTPSRVCNEAANAAALCHDNCKFDGTPSRVCNEAVNAAALCNDNCKFDGTPSRVCNEAANAAARCNDAFPRMQRGSKRGSTLPRQLYI